MSCLACEWCGSVGFLVIEWDVVFRYFESLYGFPEGVVKSEETTEVYKIYL